MIIGLHHFGMIVDDLERHVRLYEAMGFKVEHRSDYKTMGATAVMLRKEQARIELFEFADETSEIAQKVKHHFAFASDDLEADQKLYIDQGYTVAIPIDTGNVVKRYTYVENTGNFIELCEPLE